MAVPFRNMRPPHFHWASFLVLVVGIVSAPTVWAQEDASLRTGQIKAPAFSPSNPDLVAYERQVEDTRELFLYDAGSGDVQQITAVEEKDEEAGGALALFGPGPEQKLRRFEGQVAWRPVLDPEGRQWFAFVSSAGSSGSGLFLSYVDAEGTVADRVVPLPFDGQAILPDWSPMGRELVFSGSPTGTSGFDLYLFPDVRAFFGASGGGLPVGRSDDDDRKTPVQLTDNPSDELYPNWSPDGASIAYQAERATGEVRNWGINVLDVSNWTPSMRQSTGAMPRPVRMSEQLNRYHEYKPTWSPDGRYIAFYVSQSRVGSGDDNQLQDVGLLIPVSGAQGRMQGGRVLQGFTGNRIAQSVLVNENRGPTWFPSESNHALVYVKKAEEEGNPIEIADVTQWSGNEDTFSRALSEQFDRTTRFHEEVTPSLVPQGLRLAFASQVGENLQLQVRDLPTMSTAEARNLEVRQEVSRSAVAWRSMVFPGWGQFHKGQKTRGLAFALAGGTALTATVLGVLNNPTVRDVAQIPPGEVDEEYNNIRLTEGLGLAAFVGIWAYGLYDSFQGYPHYVNKPIYANESIRVDRPLVGVLPGSDGATAFVSIRVRF